MHKLQENNKEVLDFLNAKLVKDYSKLSKKTHLSSAKEEALDSLSLGTDTNKIVIYSGFGVFVAPFVTGLSIATTGMVSLFPYIDQKLTSNITQGAIEMEKFGEAAMKLGFDVMQQSLPLFAVPAGVVALSVSAKIYQMIRENKISKNKSNYALINFINDVLDDKDDETLEFSKNFFKRVDLSQINPKDNMLLVKYLAYHRYILKQYELGNVTIEYVDDAYKNIIIYLEQLQKKDDYNLKNNRFVNLLLDEYHEKEYDDFIFGEGISK